MSDPRHGRKKGQFLYPREFLPLITLKLILTPIPIDSFASLSTLSPSCRHDHDHMT